MSQTSPWPIIALIGQTNTGKSSLFNALLKQRRAIVAREPGTTRDSLGELIDLAGRRAWLVDTAGAKEPEDEFEAGIQAQLAEATATASIILLVVEAPRRLTPTDRQLAKQALKAAPQVILIANKADQSPGAGPADFQQLGAGEAVLTSTTTGQGLDRLVDCLAAALPPRTAKPPEPVDWSVALIGRPNTGKSSLFNALAAKQQALVSAQAGTTRDVNRQRIRYRGRAIDLYDTAGIRRPGQTRGLEKFSHLRTLAAINQADVCLLVIDATEPATATDQRIAGLVKTAAKGLLVLANKWDLVQSNDYDRIGCRLRQALDFVPWADWLPTSATADHNLAKVWPLTGEIMANRRRQISPDELSSWLVAAVNHHPPAGRKGLHPQLTKIQQVSHSPPTFQVSGRHANRLHWGYQRFLDNRLRQQFGLGGTGIRWLFAAQAKAASPAGSRINGAAD